MFSGIDTGTPIIIVIAVVLATFGVRLLDLLIINKKRKKYGNEYDRRRSNSNPGNSSSAVSLARIDVRLETMVDKHSELIEAVRESTDSIQELDRNEEGRHGRMRLSVTELQEKIDAGNLTLDVMQEKLKALKA